MDRFDRSQRPGRKHVAHLFGAVLRLGRDDCIGLAISAWKFGGGRVGMNSASSTPAERRMDAAVVNADHSATPSST